MWMWIMVYFLITYFVLTYFIFSRNQMIPNVEKDLMKWQQSLQNYFHNGKKNIKFYCIFLVYNISNSLCFMFYNISGISTTLLLIQLFCTFNYPILEFDLIFTYWWSTLPRIRNMIECNIHNEQQFGRIFTQKSTKINVLTLKCLLLLQLMKSGNSFKENVSQNSNMHYIFYPKMLSNFQFLL